jgi:Tfp pilus assembly protein PilP
MSHKTTRLFELAAVAALGLTLGTGCGSDEEVTGKRGAPSVPGGGKGGGGNKGGAAGNQGRGGGKGQGAGEEDEEAGPPRPPVALDSKSFGRRRDPFQSYVPTEVVLPEPDKPRAERKVTMAKYAFEDLKLIAIVNSGRGIVPRALFLASDGKSKTIRQGEYFSSAEVLLAAVNRDYVEIEVVDDDLASSLNLQRGERRAIYLRTD